MGSLGAYDRIKTLGRGASGTVSLLVRKSDKFPCAVKHIGSMAPKINAPLPNISLNFALCPAPSVDLDTLSEKDKENTQKEVEVSCVSAMLTSQRQGHACMTLSRT